MLVNALVTAPRVPKKPVHGEAAFKQRSLYICVIIVVIPIYFKIMGQDIQKRFIQVINRGINGSPPDFFRPLRQDIRDSRGQSRKRRIMPQCFGGTTPVNFPLSGHDHSSSYPPSTTSSDRSAATCGTVLSLPSRKTVNTGAVNSTRLIPVCISNPTR